jgi:hypothetical protein
VSTAWSPPFSARYLLNSAFRVYFRRDRSPRIRCCIRVSKLLQMSGKRSVATAATMGISSITSVAVCASPSHTHGVSQLWRTAMKKLRIVIFGFGTS